jgi:hypothetical protein
MSNSNLIKKIKNHKINQSIANTNLRSFLQ